MGGFIAQRLTRMPRRLGHVLALIAVVLQATQPLPASASPMMTQHCAGTSEMGSVSHSTTSHLDTIADGTVEFGALMIDNDPGCCHGLWSCDGPCGIVPLCQRPPMLVLAAPPPFHMIVMTAGAEPAHPLDLLRPPNNA